MNYFARGGVFPGVAGVLFLSAILLGVFPAADASVASPDSAATPIVISPSDPTSIQKAVQAAIRAGSSKLVIPPGVYRIAPLPTGSGPDAWHLIVENARNLEIDATGVTLIFTDRGRSSLTFTHCDNVIFRGATLVRETTPFSQGTVEAISPHDKTIDIRIAKGYPADLDDRAFWPNFWPSIFDPVTRRRKTYILAATPPIVEKLGPDLFRVHTEPQDKLPIPILPGDLLAWRGAVFADLRVFESSHMKLYDITVKGGAGFCFQESGGDGGNYYENCRVIYGDRPSGATVDPLYASNADGFHSNDARKGPTLVNCSFEGDDDDAIAIHGTYAMVLEAKGTTVTVLRTSGTRDKMFCRAGDTLRFYDENMILAGNAVVTDVQKLPTYQTTYDPGPYYSVFRSKTKVGYLSVTLDREIPAKASWLIANANANSGGFVIRNCTIHDTMARGIIAKASDGLIEGCTIERTARAAVEFNTETGIWSESDYAQNVTIRNNVFRDVSLNRRTGFLRHPGALAMFAFRGKDYIKNPGGHRNITIENNRFEGNDGVNILVCSAQGVNIHNNQFVNPMTKADDFGIDKGVDPGTLIWVNESSKVDVAGNTISNPGGYMKKTVEASATGSGTGFDTGVAIGSVRRAPDLRIASPGKDGMQ